MAKKQDRAIGILEEKLKDYRRYEGQARKDWKAARQDEVKARQDLYAVINAERDIEVALQVLRGKNE